MEKGGEKGSVSELISKSTCKSYLLYLVTVVQKSLRSQSHQSHLLVLYVNRILIEDLVTYFLAF